MVRIFCTDLVLSFNTFFDLKYRSNIITSRIKTQRNHYKHKQINEHFLFILQYLKTLICFVIYYYSKLHLFITGNVKKLK